MKVSEIMTSTVWTCLPEDSLHHAAALLWKHDCGCLPVVDAGGSLVGVITDRDICMGALSNGTRLQEISVQDCMVSPVATCAGQDDIAVAAQRLEESRVRRLPVVDAEGGVRGMVTLNDLAQAAQPLKTKTNPLATHSLSVLRAVGEPWSASAAAATLKPAAPKQTAAAAVAHKKSPAKATKVARSPAEPASSGKKVAKKAKKARNSKA